MARPNPLSATPAKVPSPADELPPAPSTEVITKENLATLRQPTAADLALENAEKTRKITEGVSQRHGAYSHKQYIVRAPLKAVTLQFPEYLVDLIKEDAMKNDASFKYIVLEALKKYGYEIHDVDNPKQGRKMSRMDAIQNA